MKRLRLHRKSGTSLGPARRLAGGPAVTLIELLVAIAVIAILAALLLPALCRSKGVAQGTRCKSNVRQVALAVGMYTLDQGVYPAYALYVTNRGGVAFDDLLRPYTSSGWLDPLYQCPGFRGRVYPAVLLNSAFPSPTHGAGGSYGYNGAGWSDEMGLVRGAGWVDSAWPAPAPPVREAEVRVPCDMLALGDALLASPMLSRGETAGINGNWFPLDYYLLRNKVMGSAYAGSLASEHQAEQARHNGLFNVAFCDGHVEGLKPVILLSTNTVSMRRWNFDHQPHNEVLASFKLDFRW